MITIFTDDFAQDNMQEIKRISLAGNLAPIELFGIASGTTYQSAVSTSWNVDKTFTVNESQSVSIIIAALTQAFADLIAGDIEAIAMSIPLFLKLQQRPEFTGI